MAKYRVTISGTWNYTTVVEAENKRDAKKVACASPRLIEVFTKHKINRYDVEKE